MVESGHRGGESQPLSTTTSWERWVDVVFAWMPYVTLLASAAIAQFGSRSTSERGLTLGLTLAATSWTWLTFTRVAAPTRLPQGVLRLYFVGFIVIAAALTLTEPVFLVYAITGFFHAALLRPWALAFIGIGATSFVVHSHIVMTESTGATWAIYAGVVLIQTVAVGAGMYAGERISEIAEERRQALEDLERAVAENAGLHDQLVAQAREAGVLDERQRMAREIHDTIAQGLTGVIAQIEAVHQSWEDEPEMRRHLDHASNLARESLVEARRSVQAIRPASLEASRLPAAIADMAERWSEVSGLSVEVHTTGERRRLRPEVEVALLRAAQEGLANIAKHADASRAGLTLSFMEDCVTLDVRDDGNGFDTSTAVADDSFGLAAMRQRIESVHGTMQIESAPGDGTAIAVTVPANLGSPAHV